MWMRHDHPWQTHVACLQVVASEVAASDTLAFSAPAMLSHPFSYTDGFHLIQSNGQVMLIAPSDYARRLSCLKHV